MAIAACQNEMITDEALSFEAAHSAFQTAKALFKLNRLIAPHLRHDNATYAA
jgi:hypothetical protein